MKQDASTPRPWRISPINNDVRVSNTLVDCLEIESEESAEWIAQVLARSSANAELIVRAVNSHDALLDALERIIAELPVRRDWLDPDLEKMARAAIELAGGKK